MSQYFILREIHVSREGRQWHRLSLSRWISTNAIRLSASLVSSLLAVGEKWPGEGVTLSLQKWMVGKCQRNSWALYVCPKVLFHWEMWEMTGGRGTHSVFVYLYHKTVGRQRWRQTFWISTNAISLSASLVALLLAVGEKWPRGGGHTQYCYWEAVSTLTKSTDLDKHDMSVCESSFIVISVRWEMTGGGGHTQSTFVDGFQQTWSVRDSCFIVIGEWVRNRPGEGVTLWFVSLFHEKVDRDID